MAAANLINNTGRKTLLAWIKITGFCCQGKQLQFQHAKGKNMPLSSLVKAVKLKENKYTLKYVWNLTVSEFTQHYKVAMDYRYWFYSSEAFLILKWCTEVVFLHSSINISIMLQDRWINGRERDKVMFSDEKRTQRAVVGILILLV